MPNENVAEQLEGVRKLRMQSQAVLDACTVTEDALSQLEQVRGEIASLSAQISTLAIEKNALTSDVKVLRLQHEAFEESAKNLAADIDHRKANAVEEIRQDTEAFFDRANVEKERIAAEFKAWRQTIGVERAKLEAEKTNLQANISDLQAKLDALRAEVLGKKVGS